jgi:hypothetical protein
MTLQVAGRRSFSRRRARASQRSVAPPIEAGRRLDCRGARKFGRRRAGGAFGFAGLEASR